MSGQDYSQVAVGQALTVPAAPGSDLLGPFVLYRLAQGEISRVEAVTFTATSTGSGSIQGPTFILQLRDPSNNVLWQYRTPPFIFPS